MAKSATSKSQWKQKKVIVAVTGGIACYKSATLVSRLVQAGAEVQVVMTDAAMKFIAALTFQTLSGRPVITSIWQAQQHYDSEHVGTARWADMAIAAPCTANTLAKLATGICDEPVSLTLAAMPQSTPVLLAPAMNAEMWASPITQRNLKTVCEVLGYKTVGPEEGWQACRTSGAGRMSEAEAILGAATEIVGS